MKPSATRAGVRGEPLAARPVVLVIDDDPDFRTALAENLCDDGFDVLHFDSPEEIPPLEELGPIDCVITDYQMPRQNGLSFADRFHATHPGVPIVMVTAWCHGNLVDEVKRRSFLRLVHKPVAYPDLLAYLPHGH